MKDPFDISGNITAERATGATEWMVHNATALAEAKARAQQCDRMLKATKALAIKLSEGKTVADRDADAYSSAEYKQAVEDEFRATLEFEKLKALYAAAQAVVDMWRSMNAAQKASRV